jgi:TRAP-type C4-dicarboxylate transport system substrate-binding protein
MRALTRSGALFAVTLAIALAMALVAEVAAEEQPGALNATVQPLKLSTALGPAYPQGKAGEIWATLIRERSGGRLAVTHFPGATLSSRDPAREFGALRDRTCELSVGSALGWSAQVPQLNVLALPWLAPGEAELDALLDGGVGKRLATILEAAGVVPVAWSANGFIELASRMPMRKPADLAGLQVRAQSSPLILETLAALGARPLAMSVANARAALENGQLDGQETSVPAFSASRLYAGPLTHLLLWHAHADVLIFAVNRSVWDAWSETDRKLVRDAAAEASKQALAMGERLVGEDALAKLGAQGAVLNRLTPAGREAFREAARAVYDRWRPIIGAELVEAAEAQLSAVQTPR